MKSLNGKSDSTQNYILSGNNTKDILKQLINRESLQDILVDLSDICDEANESNPDRNRDIDAKLLGEIIPHINN
jgi:hypothetical protein